MLTASWPVAGQGLDRPEVVGPGCSADPVINGILVENGVDLHHLRAQSTPSCQRPAGRWPAPPRRPRRNPTSGDQATREGSWGFWDGRRPGRLRTRKRVEDHSDGPHLPPPAPPPPAHAARHWALWSTGMATPAPAHHPWVPGRATPSSPRAHNTPPGIRIEPPPSEPVASGTMPAAIAAALPPEDPPGVVLQAPRVERGSEERVVGVGVPVQFRVCSSFPPPRTRLR